MNNEYRSQLALIRQRLYTGDITYAEAKDEAKPIIEAMNTQGKQIADKYSKRFKPFSFAGVMR